MKVERFDMSILDNHALLDIPLMAKFFGVTDMTVRRYIKQGLIPKPFQLGERFNSPYLWETVKFKKFLTSYVREQAKAQMF